MTSCTGFIMTSCFVARLSFISVKLKLCCTFINSNSVCNDNLFSYLYCKTCGMLYSLNCFVDPVLSGLIGILPDSAAGLLRFKCVLTLIVVLTMVSALKPD